jgi:hypothetical protein
MFFEKRDTMSSRAAQGGDADEEAWKRAEKGGTSAATREPREERARKADVETERPF